MKIKIKVKVLTGGCMPSINSKGDWIDLRSAIDFTASAPQADILKYKTVGSEKIGYRNVNMNTYHIPLGVAIKLPKGYTATVASRSSGAKKMKMFTPIGEGKIDNCYNGNNDEWCYVMSPMNDVNIKKGDRICQFTVQLSQKATMWQKIKWLFSSGIELVEVSNLGEYNRGGFGSSGIK